MGQGRIEPTPAEQLKELRKARDRYTALAERLHEHADPELDPDASLAQEQDARRIAHAYEKSISASVVRMSSMDGTHRTPRRSLSVRTWLAIFVVISGLEGGVLLAHYRPEIFSIAFLQSLAEKLRGAPVAPVAVLPKPAAPPPLPAQAANPVAVAPPKIPPAAAPVPSIPRPIVRPTPAIAETKPAVQTRTAVASKPAAQSPPVAAPIPSTPRPAAPTQAPPPVAAAPPASPPVAATPVTPPPAATAAPITPPQAPPVSTAPVLTRIEAIAATHTPPPYPGAATRLGETGTTQMRVGVSALGAATDCRIVRSSGSERLDIAACNHVQTRWRWKPATRDGQPVTASTEVTIVWNLRRAP